MSIDWRDRLRALTPVAAIQEQANAAADAATNRRKLLTGMHAAKNCASTSARTGSANQG